MSDSTQGPGWWQAADGKWYPPEQHPDYQAPSTQAIPPTPPPTAPIPAAGPPPVGPPPLGGPPVGGPPPGAPGAPNNNAKWIAIGAIAAVIIAIAAFLLLKGDDKKQNVSANSSASASSSKSSSSSSRSSSSSSKSSSSSSSSSKAPSQLTEQDIQARMLKAADIDPSFTDSTFTTSSNPTPCGGPPIDSQVSPAIDVGSESSNGEAQFQEEFLRYASDADAQQAVQLFKDSVNCTDPTLGNDTASFSAPQDVSSDIDLAVEEAIEIDFQTTEGQGKVIAVRDGSVIVTFQFFAANTADASKLPDEFTVANKGLDRLVS